MTQKRAIDKLRAELERVQNEVAELRSQAAEQLAATHQDMLTLRSQLSAARAEAGTFKRKFEVCCLCVVEACTGVGRGGVGGGGGVCARSVTVVWHTQDATAALRHEEKVRQVTLAAKDDELEVGIHVCVCVCVCVCKRGKDSHARELTS